MIEHHAHLPVVLAMVVSLPLVASARRAPSMRIIWHNVVAPRVAVAIAIPADSLEP